MQKIKILAPEFSTTHKPPAAFVVRMETVDDCLVVRYFEVLKEVSESENTVRDSMKPVTLQAPFLMRKVETQRVLVDSSAVTTAPEVAGKVLLDLGYQVFAPDSGSDSVCGFGERQDFALWCLPFTHHGKVGEPFNHYTEGESVKGKVPRVGRLRDAQTIFMLYSDVANAPLSDWKLYYTDVSPFVLEDATGGEWSTQTQPFDYISMLPNFEVALPESVNVDGTATVGVTLKRANQTVPYSGELRIEAISGYLPKSRATVSAGVASFKIMALGLGAGESVRVKIGTKNITGLADVSITVV